MVLMLKVVRIITTVLWFKTLLDKMPSKKKYIDMC